MHAADDAVDEADRHAAQAVPDDEIPELEDETMEQVMPQDFVESDEDGGPGSPVPGPDTPKLDDSQEPEEPSSKRSRLSGITAIQNLCKFEKLKSRNDVKEIIRQLDKNHKFDIKTADKQKKRMENTGASDICEVYSPPRVTAMAEKMGLNVGWAPDLTVSDPDDGLRWDFCSKAKRDKALLIYISAQRSRLC